MDYSWIELKLSLKSSDLELR